jgi:hypothetical protein
LSADHWHITLHTNIEMTSHSPEQRLFCYVDESGQDTKGQLFLVSVVITDHEYDTFAQELERIEQTSGKDVIKWHKTTFTRRLAYIKAVLTRATFAETIFFSHYAQTKEYVDLTVYTTAKAILAKAAQGEYRATVTVDGLSGVEIRRFIKGLRQLNIKVNKVRGARDESDPIIRLADAIAGFVRDYIEGKPYAQDLYKQAVANGIITEV